MMLRWLGIVSMLLLSACGGGSTPSGSRTQPPPAVSTLLATPATPWRNGVVEFSTSCVGSGALTYTWDLGDGTTKTTSVPSTGHVYLQGGSRRVSVTCLDDTQQQTRASISLEVDEIDLNAVANRTCTSTRPGHGWCAQSPLPTGAHLLGVAVPDRVTVWAVGAAGGIIKSTDAGASWVVQTSGYSGALYAIAAHSNTLAWAVGEAGTVLKTEDGGRTWQPLVTGATGTLRQVVALDAQTLWVSGVGEILSSSDGGRSWHRWSSAGTAWTSLSAPSASIVWAVGNGVVQRTADGGATWVQAGPTVSLDWVLVAAINADTAWAMSRSGVVYRTTDGGLTWQDGQALQVVGFQPIKGAVIEANTAWVLGYTTSVDAGSNQVVTGDMEVLVTRDGGRTWQRIEAPPVPYGLQTMVAESADRWWVVGAMGAIAQSVDGGRSWVSHTTGTARTLSAVTAADEQTAWATEAGDYSGNLVKTSDGGRSWFSQGSGSSSGLMALHAIDTKTVWAVGRMGQILKTTNGGATWGPQISGTSVTLGSVAAPTNTTAWVGGTDGTLLRTTDGGTSWQTQSAPTTDEVKSIAAVSTSTAWVATALQGSPQRALRRGSLRKTTDGGATWVSQLDSPTHMFLRLSAVDANTAWALSLGDGRLNQPPLLTSQARFDVFRTTDGGATWAQVWSLVSGSDGKGALRAISAVDAQRATVVGTSGVIYATQDGGSTWSRQDNGTSQGSLLAVTHVNAATAWAVGIDGLILKTLTGGQ